MEPDGVLVEEFGADNDFTYCAMIGPGTIPECCERLDPQDAPVSALQAR